MKEFPETTQEAITMIERWLLKAGADMSTIYAVGFLRGQSMVPDEIDEDDEEEEEEEEMEEAA